MPLKVTVPTGTWISVDDRGRHWKMRAEIVYPDKYSGVPHVQLTYDAPREVRIGQTATRPACRDVKPQPGTRASRVRAQTEAMMAAIAETPGRETVTERVAP